MKILTDLWKIFMLKIKKNIKIIPLDDELTAVSLSYWIIDDGSFFKPKGQVILCTDSKEEVLSLISILTNKFKLSCGLIIYSQKHENMCYRIRINKSSIPKLIKLVKSYIILSMSYKLGEI